MIPVAFDLRDPMRSGIARVARSTAKAFADQSGGRFDITAAGPPDALRQLGVESWDGGRVRVVPWNDERYTEWSWRRVRQAARDALWYFPHWDVPWIRPPERFVATVHDLAHLRPGHVSVARRVIARRWIGHAVRRARRVTVVSSFTRRALLAAWPEVAAKTVVMSNGVDESFFGGAQALPPDVTRVIGDRPFVLSVGNLKAYKNLAVGVEVLARVPAVDWVVAGEWFDDWRLLLDRAARAGVASRIHQIGQVSDSVLKALYDRAICLLFPSRYEGFGLPIIEALACGTPVVCANAVGSIETLGDAGVVCDADDPACFARAIAEFLSRGRARETVERGRHRAARFTWSARAAQLARIMESVSAQR